MAPENTDAPPVERTLAPLEQAKIDREPRCWRCKAKLAEYVARPWEFKCGRCKATNASQPSQ